MNAPLPFTHRFDADLARVAALPQPAWLSERRRALYARFQREGLPTQRHEDWKYTSLAALERADLPAAETPAGEVPAALDALASLRLVFGAATPWPGTAADLPQGVTLMPLAQALAQARPAALEYFGTLAEADALTDFNGALWDDGLYLELAPEVTLAQPIHVRQWGGGRAQLRHLLVLGSNSNATLVQHSLSGSNGAQFTNAVVECALGPGARLTHIELQQESPQALHIARTAAQLGAGSRYAHLALSAGGALTRNDLVLRLAGTGAECLLNGLTLGRGRSHTDHRVFIDHAEPAGKSRQLYKSVLWDRARAVFNGRVRVARGAVKTDARQASRNLLLSAEAEADSKPQLEIFADDVKCSHGAATGGLDAAQLFYLRSRGLDEAEARALLVEAFAAEVLDGLEGSLRDALAAWLHDRLEDRHAA
jgi:Fe-S cluster assembly protein SufD